MTKSVECCEAGDSLELAAQLMWNHDCGCLPVCNSHNGERRTIGVITDRDICMCALFQRKPLSELKVDEAMAKQVISCTVTDPLQQAERVMRGGRVRRLPVLDAAGALVGMISLADLARVAARESSNPNMPQIQAGHTLAAICSPAAQVLGP
jgi:CBS domain-containing protein